MLRRLVWQIKVWNTVARWFRLGRKSHHVISHMILEIGEEVKSAGAWPLQLGLSLLGGRDCRNTCCRFFDISWYHCRLNRKGGYGWTQHRYFVAIGGCDRRTHRVLWLPLYGYSAVFCLVEYCRKSDGKILTWFLFFGDRKMDMMAEDVKHLECNTCLDLNSCGEYTANTISEILDIGYRIFLSPSWISWQERRHWSSRTCCC